MDNNIYMNKNIKITIIIPVYNAEEFIRDCIESVIKQTLKEIEVICIDDGSSDASCEIIRQYQKNDKRITLLHQSHKGSGAARNLGLGCMRGEYVLFLDADDFYYKDNVLEKMYFSAIEQEALVCASYRVRLHGGELRDENYLGIEGNIRDAGKWLDYKEIQNEYFYQSYMFSVDIIKKNNLRFPNYLRYQDPPFLVKFMSIAKKVFVVPIKMYCYRSGHQNRNFTERQLVDVLRGMYDVLKISMECSYGKMVELLNERLNENGDIYKILIGKVTKEIEQKLREIDSLNKLHGYIFNLDLLKTKCKQSKPLFSVIVAVYNTEKYLPECIDSLINQTIKNFEIILVDDGSTDSSGEICEQYARRDKRIRVLHKDNGGLISAREAGKQISFGKYITFIDSDDWVESDNYQKLFEDYSSDFDIIVGEYVQDRDKWPNCTVFIKDKACTYTSDEATLKMFQARIYNWSGCNKLYKAEIVKKFPGWSTTNSYGEDTEFNWFMFRNAKRIAYRPVHGYHYRVRLDSMVHQDFRIERMAYLDRICSIFRDIREDEKELKSVVAELAIKFSFRCMEFLSNNSDVYIEKLISCFDEMKDCKGYVSEELAGEYNKWRVKCLSIINTMRYGLTNNRWSIGTFSAGKGDRVVYLSSGFNSKVKNLIANLNNIDFIICDDDDACGRLFNDVPICKSEVLMNFYRHPFVLVMGDRCNEARYNLKSLGYKEYVDFEIINDDVCKMALWQCH